MKIALVNPAWSFNGSIYFGCPEPHLPLELGYAKVLLEQKGHVVLLIDAQQDQLSHTEIFQRLESFRPDFIVITTAPSYLFWRCAPPELRIPMEAIQAMHALGSTIIGVGPHASTTPNATLRKLNADVVVMGECEEILVDLIDTPRREWKRLTSICHREQHREQNEPHEIVIQGTPHASDLTMLPSLSWPAETIQRHIHHHHRFDRAPTGPGAEMESSRGCPFHCTFCAKDNFREGYRKRPLAVVLDELDQLIRQGVEYVYFIDEIFLPNRELLESLVTRPVVFGVQLRIDQWNHDMLNLLGQAGCVSIEAGIESLSEAGRDLLNKHCRLSTEELTDRLIHAKHTVPFVQATLLDAQADETLLVERWRQALLRHGVWANEPVPLFPYPGSPEYTRRWGTPDDGAWERAHDYYLNQHHRFSDIQTDHPVPLSQLETIGKP